MIMPPLFPMRHDLSFARRKHSSGVYTCSRRIHSCEGQTTERGSLERIRGKRGLGRRGRSQKVTGKPSRVLDEHDIECEWLARLAYNYRGANNGGVADGACADEGAPLQ